MRFTMNDLEPVPKSLQREFLFSNVIGRLFVSGLQSVLLLASALDAHALQLLGPYPFLPDLVSGNSPEHCQAALCACPHLHRARPEGKDRQCGSWR